MYAGLFGGMLTSAITPSVRAAMNPGRFSLNVSGNAKKNVIIILTDSLRPDFLGFYGNNWIKTPNLDKFASESAVFDRAYCEGLPTLPTRTAMFTGKFTFPFRGWQRLETEDVLLSEILWDKGISTALITDVYHMHKPRMTYERGFDYVEWIRGQEGDPYIIDKSVKVDVDNYFKGNGQKNEDAHREQLQQYLKNVSWWKGEEDHFIAQVVKAGISYLKKQSRARGTFLFLDCFDPHEPWDPPPPYNKMYNPDYRGKELIHPIPGEVAGYLSGDELEHVKSLYAGEVSLVDKWVGIFIDALKEMDFYDNSLIIYCSDHGEPFGEHRIVRKARPWPYEEVARIPLAIKHPDGSSAGKHLDAFVQTCDLMPTILDYLDIELPEDLTAESLMPLLTGSIPKIRDYACSAYYKGGLSIRDKEWTYLRWQEWSRRDDGFIPWENGGTRGAPTSPELYFRKEDQFEQNNILEKEPDKAKELHGALMKFVKKLQT